MDFIKQLKRLLLVAVLPTMMVACSDDKDDKKDPKKFLMEDGTYSQLFEQYAAQVITVVGPQNEPISGAQILIGQSLDQPFSGNFVTTDKAGQFVAPADWDEAMPVTVNAFGYIRATFLHQVPEGQTYKLRLSDSNIGQFEISGVTKGYTDLSKDGWLDFAITMPAFTRLEVFNFDISGLISPIMDKIKVANREVEIPSNIAIPSQRESYIIPVTIAKERYRLFFKDAGIKKVYGLHGKFPFTTVVDQLRAGRPFYDMINYFKLQEAGIRDIALAEQKAQQDIPINEIKFNAKRTVKAPALSADQYMVVAALNETLGYYVPSDVKNLSSGQSAQLNFPQEIKSAEVPRLLSVLQRKADANADTPKARMSVMFANFEDQIVPSFLPLIDDPKLGKNGEVIFNPPQGKQAVDAVATYAVLSTLQNGMRGGYQVKIPNRIWEVYSHDWIEVLDLPVWPQDVPPAGSKRWDVSFIGSNSAQTTKLGPAVLDNATHVTHSNLDY